LAQPARLSSGAARFLRLTFLVPALHRAQHRRGAGGAVSDRRRDQRRGDRRQRVGVVLRDCACRNHHSQNQPAIRFHDSNSKVFISASVNVRHLPSFNSPSLIFPIWIRCNRFTVKFCDSNSRRTSRFLPSLNSSSTTLCGCGRRKRSRFFRLQLFARVKNAARELRQHRPAHFAFDRRDVFFADAVARMRQAQRELSIIRQKNQSLAVEIQTAHGMDDLPFFWQQS
jgi:hypothetical protein